MPLGIPGAILAGGAISGGLSFLGAKSASKEAARAAEKAARIQFDMYMQMRGDLAPYTEAGKAALGQASQTVDQQIQELEFQKSDLEQRRAKAELSAKAATEMRQNPRTGEWEKAPVRFRKKNQPEYWNQQVQSIDRQIAELRRSGKDIPGTGLLGMLETGPGEFEESPGYQFRLQEGVKALQRSAAASGNLLSGKTGKALVRYGQEYGAGEYQNFLNRYYQKLEPLQRLVAGGQSAAAGQGAAGIAAGQTAGNYLLSGGINAANANLAGIAGISSIANRLIDYKAMQSMAGGGGPEYYNMNYLGPKQGY